MSKKFFWKDTSGLNADIERHRKKEQELEQKIAELEAIPEQERDSFTDCNIRTYRHFIYQLQISNDSSSYYMMSYSSSYSSSGCDSSSSDSSDSGGSCYSGD